MIPFSGIQSTYSGSVGKKTNAWSPPAIRFSVNCPRTFILSTSDRPVAGTNRKEMNKTQGIERQTTVMPERKSLKRVVRWWDIRCYIAVFSENAICFLVVTSMCHACDIIRSKRPSIIFSKPHFDFEQIFSKFQTPFKHYYLIHFSCTRWKKKKKTCEAQYCGRKRSLLLKNWLFV